VPERAARGRRPACELDDHHLAGRRATLLAGRHEHIHQHSPVERDHVTHTGVVTVVAAHERTGPALENADDLSFGAPPILDALDPHDDAVAVHRFVKMLVGNVDIAARWLERTLRRHEPIAGWIGLQPADVQVHFFGQTETIAPNLNELA
jgi:hypothetical protein